MAEQTIREYDAQQPPRAGEWVALPPMTREQAIHLLKTRTGIGANASISYVRPVPGKWEQFRLWGIIAVVFLLAIAALAVLRLNQKGNAVTTKPVTTTVPVIEPAHTNTPAKPKHHRQQPEKTTPDTGNRTPAPKNTVDRKQFQPPAPTPSKTRILPQVSVKPQHIIIMYEGENITGKTKTHKANDPIRLNFNTEHSDDSDISFNFTISKDAKICRSGTSKRVNETFKDIGTYTVSVIAYDSENRHLDEKHCTFYVVPNANKSK